MYWWCGSTCCLEMDNVTIAGAAAVIWKLPLFSYTRKCLHFSLLPAPVPVHVVLFSKWYDGLDILVLGVPSLVSHWKRTMSLQLWRCWLYTRKCLHFCLLPALFLNAVLLFKWSDGLDIFSGFLGKGLCPPPCPKEP